MNQDWTDYPLLQSIRVLPGHRLLCDFRNGESRTYDFRRHLDRPMFQLLKDETIFRTASVDPHGLGIVWTDDMDIAASELWINGAPVDSLLAHA